jgi:hypothetical protein
VLHCLLTVVPLGLLPSLLLDSALSHCIVTQQNHRHLLPLLLFCLVPARLSCSRAQWVATSCRHLSR